MKCIFNEDGSMFLVAKNDHADIQGKTSVIVPDGVDIRKSVLDEEGNTGVIEVTLPELNQRIDDFLSVYTNARKEAYPSIVDQLDTLYHGGFDAWHAQIQAVKEQYPKLVAE